jgi:hypothetical protein
MHYACSVSFLFLVCNRDPCSKSMYHAQRRCMNPDTVVHVGDVDVALVDANRVSNLLGFAV